MKYYTLTLCLLLITSLYPQPSHSREKNSEGFLGKIIKKKMEQRENENNNKGSKEGLYIQGSGKSENLQLGDRTFTLYTPKSFDKTKNRPLLIVLHGGFGSAKQIQNYIGLDPLADKFGFAVAYMDGTQVARKLPEKFKGWNAGDCCGQPQANNIDDVSFISGAIEYMHNNYGIDKSHVYGTGHSNGAMMTQRIICETDLYKDAITLSGTLQMDVKTCTKSKGSRIKNIHGAKDTNLPVEGGHTVEGFNKKTDYNSQESTKSVFAASGTNYELLILEEADHSPATLNEGLINTYGKTLPETIVEYLNLD